MLYMVRPHRDDTDEVYIDDVSDWMMLHDSDTTELKKVSLSDAECLNYRSWADKTYKKYNAKITEDSACIGEIYYKLVSYNSEDGDCRITIKGFCNQTFWFSNMTAICFHPSSYMVVRDDKLLFRFFVNIVYNRYLEFTLITDLNGNFIDFVVPDVCVCTNLFWVFEEKCEYKRLN